MKTPLLLLIASFLLLPTGPVNAQQPPSSTFCGVEQQEGMKLAVLGWLDFAKYAKHHEQMADTAFNAFTDDMEKLEDAKTSLDCKGTWSYSYPYLYATYTFGVLMHLWKDAIAKGWKSTL